MCPFLSLFILLLILFTYYNLLKFFGLSFFPPQGLIGLLGISWDNFGLSFCISEFVTKVKSLRNLIWIISSCIKNLLFFSSEQARISHRRHSKNVRTKLCYEGLHKSGFFF